MSRSVRALIAVAALLAAPAPSRARSEDPRPPAESVALEGPTLGWVAAAGDVDAVARAIDGATAGRVVARVEARWDEVETAPGAYDWSAVRRTAEAYRVAGAVVVLALVGSHPDHVPGGGWPSPFVEGSVEAWTRFARGAVRAMQGEALVFEVAPGDPVDVDPEVTAYVLKNTAIALRAEAREQGVRVLVAQAAVPADRLDLQRALWSFEVAPYVDVLPVRFASGDDPARLVAFREAALEHPPAPAPWVVVEGDDAPALALTALAEGASTALLALEGDDDRRAARVGWTVAVQAALAEGFAAAPPENVRFEAGASGPAGARLVATYFSDESFETLLVVDPGGSRTDVEPLLVVLPSAFARNVRTVDPATGVTRRVPARPVAGDDRSRSVAVVASGAGPVLVRYQSAAPLPEGVRSPDEDLAVERDRGLTAQEIIARHQEVRKRQDDRLERWTGRAQVDFHFRFAQGGPTIDVTVLSNYFWERGGELEWEQTDYYLNGNRVRWKKIPQLPLVQPEKVVTLPLDLTLDRTYAYTLGGEDRVGDRDAYVLAFEPAEPDADGPLYRGRVWIDRETFVRLKASVVQTGGLDSPVLSNEEVDRYAPVEGPDGREYWMLSEVDGQQVWNAGGRNFVVRRELRFESFDLNPAIETFDAARARAYASDNQMLRDTVDGFRYLRREDDGTRTVETEIKTRQLFALAGALQDSSTSGVIPLAGVNWFDYETFGRNIQTNLFFAGPLAFGTLTVPELFDRKIDVTFDVGLSALKTEDKVFVAGTEATALRIRDRTQRAAVRFGFPLGSFVKLNLIGSLDVIQYFDSDEGRDARPPEVTFVLPEDHRVSSVGAEVLFNRRGWVLETRGEYARRSSWAPWGAFDAGTGTFVGSGYDPAQRSFQRWGASLSHEWFLPHFQKIRAEIGWLGSSDVDRFSEYRFSFFGDDRLFGFSGSGVRFDRGGVARAGYLFNLLEVVRLQASVETARVRSARDGGVDQNFTGVGLSGNFVGPWKTVINLDWGYSLASDVPELEGEHEFLVLIFKLF